MIALLVLAFTMPVPVYSTSAPMELYVAADGGSDSYACDTPASPCATIQGALARTPSQIRHKVHINVAAGAYGAFTVQAFSAYMDTSAPNAGLHIEGGLADAPVDAGAAEGQASGGTLGSAQTWGTLSADAGWGSNNLRGFHLVLTGGTGAGQTRVVSSNTGSIATIVGQWGTAPDSTTTFAVQTPSVHITSCGPGLPWPDGDAGTSVAQVIFANNALGNHNGGYGQTTVMLEGLSFEASCASVQIYDDSSVTVYNSRSSSSTGTSHFQTREGNLVLSAVDSYYPGTSGTHVGTGTQGGAVTVQFSLMQNGTNGYVNSGGTGYIVNSEVLDVSTNAIFNRPNLNGVTIVQQDRLDCSSDAGVAVLQGGVGLSPLAFSIAGGGTIAQAIDVHDCGWGVRAIGPGYVSMVSANGLVANTGAPSLVGIEARSGAMVIFDPSMVSWTAPPIEASIDNGAATSTLAAIAASSCLTAGTFGSRVCKP